jgi:hypothetical protein
MVQVTGSVRELQRSFTVGGLVGKTDRRPELTFKLCDRIPPGARRNDDQTALPGNAMRVVSTCSDRCESELAEGGS